MPQPNDALDRILRVAEQRMRALDVSQNELARRTGIGQSTINEWFTLRRPPSLAHAIAVGKVLNINIHYWLTGDGPAEPPTSAHDAGAETRVALLTLTLVEQHVVNLRQQFLDRGIHDTLRREGAVAVARASAPGRRPSAKAKEDTA